MSIFLPSYRGFITGPTDAVASQPLSGISHNEASSETTVVASQPGYLKRSLTFDEQTNNRIFINSLNASSEIGSGDASIAVWIKKPSGHTGESGIVHLGGSNILTSGSGGRAFTLYVDDDTLYVRTPDKTNTSVMTLSDDTWTHVVATWVGSTGDLNVYVNDVEELDTTLTGGNSLDSGDCLVGNIMGVSSPNRPSAVKIAAASIWERVLSSTEAGNLHDYTSTPSDLSTDLIFDVELEDGEGGDYATSGTNLTETVGTYYARVVGASILWHNDGPELI